MKREIPLFWIGIGAMVIAACASPFVASMTVDATTGSLTARPTVLARFDGDVFVGWAESVATAEVFAAESGGTVYGPVTLTAGYAVVHVRSEDFRWKGTSSSPMPISCRSLFRDAEIDRWGLTFEEIE